MKRIISNVMLVAAAATAFFSCQKQEVIAPETSQEVMLTFSSEKPAFDDETKTEWTGETIHWSAGDKISVAYTVAGNWQSNSGDAEGNAKIYQSNPINEADSVANFSVPTYFTGETAGTHIFYAVYPVLGDNKLPNAPVANISISPNQNPKAESFDSSADVMVGVSGEYATRPASNETISLQWNRLVAHAVLTLKDINGFTEGEVIESITLTAQDGANLVGMQNVNLITREFEKNEQNTSSNVLKISANNLTVNNGTVTFWACVLPETLTALTVEVNTDKATYTREITGISKIFKQNARNTLSIKMNEAVREENVVASDEVVDILNRELTGVTGTSYTSWSDKTSVSDAVYAGQSAGGNESIQLRSNNSNSGIVTTTSGGLAKKVVVTWNSNTSSGRTLSVYGSNTAYTNPTDLYSSETQGTDLGSIECGTSTELIIDGDYEYLGFRSKSGAMYVEEIKITWSTGPVTPDTTPSVELEVEELEIAAEESEGTIAIEANNIEAIEVRALVAEGAQEESDWLIADYDEDNSCVTYLAAANDSEEARTAYIEVYCLDADANVIVAGVNVTQAGVVNESELPVGITSIYDAITSEANTTLDEFSVSLTDAVVTYVNGNSAFVEDATAGILIYKLGHGLVAGDKLNGVLTGKGYVRYGVCQITEFDMANVTKETGATIPCIEISVADLLGDYASYVSRRVKIVDATVTDGITGTSDKNGAISQNGSSVNLYNNTSVNFVETEVVDFYAYPSYYSSTKQLATWEAPTTKKVATPVITCASNVVTITCGTTGASIYYAIGEDDFVAYSEGVQIDETVTVKAYATKTGLVDSETASQECEYVDLSTQPTTVEATLSFANKAQRTTFTTSQQVWTQNGITLTNDKAASTSNVADYANPARFYKSSKITIDAPGNITKIEFTCNSSSYATALKSSIASGTGTVTVSGSVVTVVPSSSATSFVIASLTGGQVRMNSLMVTYEN